MELKEYFQQAWQDSQNYSLFRESIVNTIFAGRAFVFTYGADMLDESPTVLEQTTGIKALKKIGYIRGVHMITFFDVTLEDNVNIAVARVGIQKVVRRLVGHYASAFMMFHYENPIGKDWRFSFYSNEGVGNSTSAKRFTYVLGPNQTCRTAVERFHMLVDIAQQRPVTNDDLLAAFAVETLSNTFFEKYNEHYAKFVNEISGSSASHDDVSPIFTSAFKINGRTDEQAHKAVRDFVKKMQGRIVFLYFLQKKGWLLNDRNFMQNLFLQSEHQDDFLEKELEPLFFGVLNTKPEAREEFFKTQGYNIELAKRWKDIPYLNGGLFENDKEDDQKVQFKACTWQAFFDFLSQYNFTIDENDPEDMEVGIDPEMLGRIFESQLEDNHATGAFYTPKHIVQYMCRRALQEYLKTTCAEYLSEEEISRLLDNHSVPSHHQEELIQALKKVKICDPAIGSGAFPMGLLNELHACRRALGDETKYLRQNIIENNIYGVDIEKGAIDIARLRFWLSLIIEREKMMM